ncbi:MAG: MOSC domain-containing protein [PVC group bacterium]
MKKSGKVTQIRIGREKGSPRESLREGFFKVNFGLAGDTRSGPGEKQVTLFGVKGRKKLKASPEEGLCFQRFVETITTEGIDLYQFPTGTRLEIGESIQEISRAGKKCYPECVLIRNKKPCIMPEEVVFTRVIEGGTVRVGDAVEVLTD